MSFKDTIKKIIRGQELDWHLPATISPDEDIARCARCSVLYVIGKSEKRAVNYCWGCK
jgi:hypothetical protein